MKRLLAKKETVPQALAKSSILAFLSKGLGYLKYLAIAYFLGFGAKTDAYFIAISLLGLFAVFADVFDSIGVPNLVRALQSSKEEFENLAGVLLTFTTILAVTLAFLALILSPILPYVAIGFTKANQAEVRKLFLILIPYLFLSFFFHHCGAILRSQRKFTVFFIGNFIFSIVSCGYIFAALPFIRKVWVLPASFTIGQLIATLFILYYSREYLSFKWQWNSVTKKIGKQFLSLTGVYFISHIFTITDNAFASLLPIKIITALNYGLAIAGIPGALLPFANISITPLSETDADIQKAKRYFRFLLLYSFPFILLTWLFISPALKILLGYGRFSNLDLNLTSEAAKYYIFSLPLMMVWGVLYRIFLIKDKVLMVLFFIFITALLNIGLKYLFIIHLHFGLIGIPLTTFIINFALCAVAYQFFLKISKNAAEGKME